MSDKKEFYKHVLITGGHGYIGKNMKEYLRNEAYCSYTSIDKKRNTYTQDITDCFNFDGVIHLSAISGIPQCEENKEQAYIDNIASTLTIMRAAHESKIPLVYASSQAANFQNNFYALTKWIGEQEAFRLNAKGANIKVLRFSNVYGGVGWEDKTNVVAMFRKAKESGKPIIVNGTGEQKRDFIHVKDLCRAIWLALTYEGEISKPMDIGTGQMVSIKEVAEMFEAPIEYNADSEWIGVMENVANTINAEHMMGFKSEIEISPESIYQ